MDADPRRDCMAKALRVLRRALGVTPHAAHRDDLTADHIIIISPGPPTPEENIAESKERTRALRRERRRRQEERDALRCLEDHTR
jgi:anthranilate/para-aminobenzoate synthase component II